MISSTKKHTIFPPCATHNPSPTFYPPKSIIPMANRSQPPLRCFVCTCYPNGQTSSKKYFQLDETFVAVTQKSSTVLFRLWKVYNHQERGVAIPNGMGIRLLLFVYLFIFGGMLLNFWSSREESSPGRSLRKFIWRTLSNIAVLRTSCRFGYLTKQFLVCIPKICHVRILKRRSQIHTSIFHQSIEVGCFNIRISMPACFVFLSQTLKTEKRIVNQEIRNTFRSCFCKSITKYVIPSNIIRQDKNNVWCVFKKVFRSKTSSQVFFATLASIQCDSPHIVFPSSISQVPTDFSLLEGQPRTKKVRFVISSLTKNQLFEKSRL